MKEYHKIDSVYKRDQRGKFLIGEFSRPEFEYLKDCPWLWTEKIDGTNIRIMWDGKDIRIGGREENSQINTKLLAWINDHISPETFFKACLEQPLCLYGEGYGAGIQKGGGNYSSEQKFILFDVKIGNFWLERKNVEDIANKLGLDVVSKVSNLTLDEMIQEFQKGELWTSDVNDKATMEGVVGTPLVPLFARNGDRIITKIKYRDFR